MRIITVSYPGGPIECAVLVNDDEEDDAINKLAEANATLSSDDKVKIRNLPVDDLDDAVAYIKSLGN